ncbi:gas vesicle protein [Kitasatospora sp. RB6PN24]|uniref:gas vesicle protein GvpO n=1 Tax=Kitasatospora humi TaxID=2893891 RepID=UPI001E4AD196|nr:gas vesicle protein GvpO [Kitasatospora humi]MCC9307828.1 gas vesicle protein [Kitasatospora humi]
MSDSERRSRRPAAERSASRPPPDQPRRRVSHGTEEDSARPRRRAEEEAPRPRRRAEEEAPRPRRRAEEEAPRPRRRAAEASDHHGQDEPPRRLRRSEGEDAPAARPARPERTARRTAPQERPARPERTAHRKTPTKVAGIGAAEAAAKAAAQVQTLTGRGPEGVTALERTGDGWRIGIEVLETRRIPDSTDILAVYEVMLDEDGDLVSYRRESRYYRGRANREEQ